VPTIKEIAVIEHKQISREDVAQRAYELYVQRGENPGKDVEDWIRAEKELGTEQVVAPTSTMAVRAGQNN
jgi:Protein of unknown function (DUF2934)